MLLPKVEAKLQLRTGGGLPVHKAHFSFPVVISLPRHSFDTHLLLYYVPTSMRGKTEGRVGVAILRQRQLFKMFLNPHSSDCQSNSVRQDWPTEKQRLREGRNSRVLSTCLPLCKELGTHLLCGLSNGALKGTCMTEIITPGTEASNPLFLTPPPSLKCENFYLLQL